MIPQRIQLRGFLCYRDEQEIRFADAPVWLLAGTNGSGKSTVFDALTYALFGYHRGGSQHAQELVNKDCDSLAVEFDFRIDQQDYRIKRTLKRTAKGTASTQLISRRQPIEGNSHSEWVPIEGTTRKADFDAWVRDTIGLTYETFTSSVLLLQGKAEKLLDSTAKGRFEVLAGIVDLDRYELLHRKADEQRKGLEGAVRGLRDRLGAVPEVAPIELAEAGGRISSAAEARDRAQAEVERFVQLEAQARQWLDLQVRLTAAQSRVRRAEQLCADAPAIERDLNRLRDLREVLPHVQTVIEQNGQLMETARQAEELLRRLEELQAKLVEQDHAREQTQKKLDTVQADIAREEGKHRQVVARFREKSVLLEKVREYERQEADLNRLMVDLGRLPADPVAAMSQAQAAHDHLTALVQVVPLLARFRTHRDQLQQARAGLQQAEKAQGEVLSLGKQLGTQVEPLRTQRDQAATACQEARDRLSATRTLAQQAREQLAVLGQLEGAKVCRQCGQPLTPGHLEEERARRKQELAEAERDSQAASARVRSLDEQARLLGDRFADLEKQLQEAREQYRDHLNQARQAAAERQRLEEECRHTWAELPERFRTQVSADVPTDWCATAFPSEADLNGLRSQTAEAAVTRRRLDEAQGLLQQWNQLKGRETTIREALERLQTGLPADRQSVRKDHVHLEAEEKALSGSLSARRAEAREAQDQLDRLNRQHADTQQKAAETRGKLGTQEATRLHCQQVLQKALKALPDAWQDPVRTARLRELEVWKEERDRLAGKGIEERGRELQQSRLSLEGLRQDLQAVQAQCDQFPAEARQEPAALEAALSQARQEQRTCEEELSQARQQLAVLEGHQRQRKELQTECLRLEREHSECKLLAELLGRDRLQLYLVRQAERQVVDFANAVLDRLSGGQLYLRLAGEAGGEGNTAKALELEVFNRVTGERPINVAFLSGSQRFRVAVSLALGIGQYASRQHRPIESVIIDEGFGCLDRQGRQVMIQELQNLRGQMRCILLVSHQEEFADAFADGYRFELDNGAARITRFQRC